MSNLLLSVQTHFDAAHRLPFYDGPCNRLHGHRWEVIVTYKGSYLPPDGPKQGMLCDFKDVKETLKKHIHSRYDHEFLNQFPGLPNPTAELIALEIFSTLRSSCPKNLTLHSVKLFESPECSIEVTND